MQKDWLYLRRYIHFWSQKCLNVCLFCELFRSLREENIVSITHSTTTTTHTLCAHLMFFGPQYAYFYLKWLVHIYLFMFYTKWPFSTFIVVAWSVHNIATFPRSLWCMDACSVYNITIRKCRVVFTLSLWSVCKGHTEWQLSLFCLGFPPSCKKKKEKKKEKKKRNFQIVNVTSNDGICRQCWEDRAVAPGLFESAVRWGEGTQWDQRNVWESFRLSHWQSRRTGGSGVSARCRKTPYCHLWTEGKVRVSCSAETHHAVSCVYFPHYFYLDAGLLSNSEGQNHHDQHENHWSGPSLTGSHTQQLFFIFSVSCFSLDFFRRSHINPHWSIGYKVTYYEDFNYIITDVWCNDE